MSGKEIGRRMSVGKMTGRIGGRRRGKEIGRRMSVGKMTKGIQ